MAEDRSLQGRCLLSWYDSLLSCMLPQSSRAKRSERICVRNTDCLDQDSQIKTTFDYQAIDLTHACI